MLQRPEIIVRSVSPQFWLSSIRTPTSTAFTVALPERSIYYPSVFEQLLRLFFFFFSPQIIRLGLSSDSNPTDTRLTLTCMNESLYFRFSLPPGFVYQIARRYPYRPGAVRHFLKSIRFGRGNTRALRASAARLFATVRSSPLSVPPSLYSTIV